MTDYQIDCVNKWDRRSAHEHITNVEGPNPSGSGRWTNSVENVVRLIEQHSHCFYTNERGAQAWLGVRASPSLRPQAHGYAFEKFLKDLFDAHRLAAQERFRLRGEQIDGSFQFGNETYFVEAKWQGEPIGGAELHTFHGKVEQKAAWTHGLFVSNSGFTDEGLREFGRGKRVICMNGFDLYETLDRKIPLNHVLERKVGRAAETGSPFIRVRDLFPH